MFLLPFKGACLLYGLTVYMTDSNITDKLKPYLYCSVNTEATNHLPLNCYSSTHHQQRTRFSKDSSEEHLSWARNERENHQDHLVHLQENKRRNVQPRTDSWKNKPCIHWPSGWTGSSGEVKDGSVCAATILSQRRIPDSKSQSQSFWISQPTVRSSRRPSGPVHPAVLSRDACVSPSSLCWSNRGHSSAHCVHDPHPASQSNARLHVLLHLYHAVLLFTSRHRRYRQLMQCEYSF